MASEQQKDEIIALESIYTSEEFSYNQNNDQYQCSLKIFISLPEGFYLLYKDERNKDEVEEKVPISHLPPLKLYMTLPKDYPEKSPPEFTLYCSWMTPYNLIKLCRKLDKLWIENKPQEIIFTWGEFLQNETLEFLKIKNNLNLIKQYTFYKKTIDLMQEKKTRVTKTNRFNNRNFSKANVSKRSRDGKNNLRIDRRGVVDRGPEQNVIEMLVNYNEERTSIEFKKNFYTCKVCFMDKSGESCTQFKPCLHIFCKDCITGYLQVRIKEGAVQNINCPEEKCTSEASPAQIKELVSPELFLKYDSTLLSATLDTMLDIVYCPRRHCQYPVSKEPNEKMASCPACNYVFCIYCKMVYHGIEPCKVSCAEKQKLVSDYQNATELCKQQLENRYGKKQLQMLVENTMSENWINSNSRNCPHCNTAIEKSDGCNKMTCGRCNTYFCWVCGTRLNPSMPYFHYQDPQSKCYKLLYQGMVIDDEDDDEIDFPAVYLDYDSEDDDLSDEDFVIDYDI
ncbi:E3 ubiquitin-protein ligase RNF14 [Microplitis demolitor]|uniref:E3 ubiquitin-protein ligase RNF14 n=1 Tax=Microplitis demolitor TaxID=69319 RepID=UPI0004CDD40A|nr:E3 ubiquitin-protein ligase RNF14 [Microplitis demolitor]